jgi:two-component system phosphate regulon sensor histidine kinase PhoR
VKKIFTIITVLITLSLLGIIYIQLSWLRNMVLLREEQIKHNVDEATKMVGEELSQYKGNPASSSSSGRWVPGQPIDQFTLELIRPVTVGQKFTVPEIREKLNKAFFVQGLKDVQFEFGLATISPRGPLGYIERQSADFARMYADTVNNYTCNYLLISPSGSPAENLVSDEVLIVVVPNIKNLVLHSLRWSIIASVLFTFIIVAAFYLTVRTMLKQKKLSDIKNDFINNMTHEFKTPLATISLAVDALKNDKVQTDKEKMNYFSNIIKEENQRMNRQVETILKAALLDKQEVSLMLKPTHLHDVIRNVAGNFALQLEEKKGKIELQLNAPNDLIEADEVHLPNLITNLVDNAVKYSKENEPPHITISTSANGKNMILTLEDNGIGMNRETLKRIFEKFYRAHTGNIHNVKGFGLGLSYVKTMVDAHGGTIKADSAPGKGSIFTIEFPLKKESETV